MSSNIAANTNKTLKRWPIIENYCWTDSQVALSLIERPFGGRKSFISHRVKRIQEITDEIEIKWKHVPTKMNHADAGSRGASYRQLEKVRWSNGPYWLVNQSSWPGQENQSYENDEKIKKEVKVDKEQLLVTSTMKTVVDTLLEKATLKKTKRVVAWWLRFFHNSKSQMLKIQQKLGPLTREEVEKANNHLIIKAHEGFDLNSREAQK